MFKFPIKVDIDEKLLNAVPRLKLFSGNRKIFDFSMSAILLLVSLFLFPLSSIISANNIRIFVLVLANLFLIISVIYTLYLISKILKFRNEEAKKILEEFQNEAPFISSFYTMKNKNTISITIKYFLNDILQVNPLYKLDDSQVSIIAGLFYCSNKLVETKSELIPYTKNDKNAILWSIKSEELSLLMLNEDNEVIYKELFDLTNLKTRENHLKNFKKKY